MEVSQIKKKENHELISVEDCIDELIYGTSETVVRYQVNGKLLSEEEYTAIIREEYIADPPAGYTADEIRNMSIDTLLDMDYFLNE